MLGVSKVVSLCYEEWFLWETSLALKQQGTTYPFRATSPFNQLLGKRSFPEAICRAAQAACSGYVRRSLHLCPGAVSCFPFPGSWPLLKAPHTQLVLISKQPSACPLVWPSLLSSNELLMSSNEEQRAGWRPGQSSLIAFDPLLLPRVQLFFLTSFPWHLAFLKCCVSIIRPCPASRSTLLLPAPREGDASGHTSGEIG